MGMSDFHIVHFYFVFPYLSTNFCIKMIFNIFVSMLSSNIALIVEYEKLICLCFLLFSLFHIISYTNMIYIL